MRLYHVQSLCELCIHLFDPYKTPMRGEPLSSILQMWKLRLGKFG